MRSILALALSLFSPNVAVTEDAASPNSSAILAMGAYVATDDMEGSEAFYRSLFDRTPSIELPDFVAFDVAGGWFAIVSRGRYAPQAQPGSGAVPYLQSADLETLRTRLAATGADAPEIIKEPGIHLLKVRDPNGQLIEFFKLVSQ